MSRIRTNILILHDKIKNHQITVGGMLLDGCVESVLSFP